MARRRPIIAAVRLTPDESADWRTKGAAEAVEIVARLVAIERALRALAPVGDPDTDAH